VLWVYVMSAALGLGAEYLDRVMFDCISSYFLVASDTIHRLVLPCWCMRGVNRLHPALNFSFSHQHKLLPHIQHVFCLTWNMLRSANGHNGDTIVILLFESNRFNATAKFPYVNVELKMYYEAFSTSTFAF
jgi:hypothetical protein